MPAIPGTSTQCLFLKARAGQGRGKNSGLDVGPPVEILQWDTSRMEASWPNVDTDSQVGPPARVNGSLCLPPDVRGRQVVF